MSTVKKMKRILSILLVAVLAASLFVGTPATASAVSGENNALYYFENPDYTAKPMARMWFPDATAGIDEHDVIAKQINALAEAGFGGVEIAMLSDSASYTNDQAAYCGWGTESWVKLLKKVYAAANAIEGGFVIDLTITAHWPPCVNTIDPNDEAASQEISSSFTKVTPEALENGSIALELPETDTADGKNAHFIFTDTLINAVLVRVDSTKEETTIVGGGWGGGGTPVTTTKLMLDYSTMQPVSASATGEGRAAGVPDEAACEAYGWNYADTIAAFGPEPDMDTVAAGSKLDADGNRVRMADWQDYYAADLSGIALDVAESGSDEIGAGDWVILTSFVRGTGQLFNGGSATLMHNRPYVMNFFALKGIQAVTDYWDNHILTDSDLAAMIRENGGSIFEDSIEANVSTSLWVSDLPEELTAYYGEDYAYAELLPAIVGGYRGGGGFGASPGPDLYDFVNAEVDGSDMEYRIRSDYNSLMGYLYEYQHCIPANEWADSIGSSYRAQTYDLTGLDIAGAAATVTIPEGDNMTKGDGLRQLSAAVNLYDKKFLSMEAITGWTQYQFNWETILYELTANFSWGVNRAIFHGTAYSKAVNGFHADWPGWDQFGGSFGEPYTYRQVYWDQMDMLTDYVSRIQALMQYTTQKIDVVAVRDGTEAFENPSGNSLQAVLDHGYSYNIMSEALLLGENAQKVSNGKIYEDGPGYRAVVLNEVTTMSCDAMDVILRYAAAGIPVIAVDSSPSTVYGTENAHNNDALLAEKYAELLSYDCVAEVASADEIPAVLKELGVTPYAQYAIDSLETTRYNDETDGTSYYYLFNNNSTFAGMISGTGGKDYKNGTYGYDIKDAAVTLEGEGTPYILDAMSGEVTQAGQYTVNGDGTVTVIVDSIKAGNAVIVALSDNYDAFPAPSEYVQAADDGEDYEIVRNADGTVALRSSTAGTYFLRKSDGSSVAAVVNAGHDAVDLTNADWSLVLDSYGPTYPNASEMVDDRGIQTVDPSDTTITTVDFGNVELKDWAELDASAEMLAAMGVKSMDEVSGKGFYTTTFDWDGSDASLWISYGNDQFTGLTVNGMEIPALNNMTDTVDLGGYLVEGKNTITIEISTTLNDRARVESDVFRSKAATVNGLLQATLTPYTTAGFEEMSVSAPASAQVCEPFSVTVVTPASVQSLRLYNEYDMGIACQDIQFVENEDGSKTWTLTAAVGTVGKGRTFKVVANADGYGVYNGLSFTMDILSAAPALTSFTLPDTAVANRTFIVKATTDMTATKIAVYNEFGAKMGIKSLSYKVVDGQKVWTGVMAIGTKGERTFTAYASNKYGVQSDALTDSVSVKAYA